VALRDVVLAESGLQSFWEFAETTGTNAADSIGVSPGTYTGGFTLGEPGIPNGGYSIKLNGTTGWVRVVRNGTSLDIGDGPLTLEAWCKQNALLTKGIICRGQAAAYLRVQSSAGNLQLDSTNVADIVSSTTTPFASVDGKWRHCVVTKNGATVKLYIDGVDVTGTITNSTCTSPAEDLAIGQQRAAGAGAEWFNGWIAYPAVYNVVLTPTQVANHYAAGIALPTVIRSPLVEMYSQGNRKRQLAISLMQAKPAVGVAGGTNFVQGLTASAVAVTAALTKQVGKLSTAASLGVTASLTRQTNKALTATSVVVTASLVAMKVILKALTATAVVVTASLLKQVNKPLTATPVVLSATLVKQINKFLTATTVLVTASLVAIKVILRTLTATTVVVSASLVRQINKPLIATSVALSSSLVKQVNKKLTATTVAVTSTLAAIKVILKTLTATSVVVTASLVRQVRPTLIATSVVTAAVMKSVAKTLTASSSAVASLVASFVAQAAAVVSAVVRIIDTVLAAVGLVDSSSASVSAQDASAASVTATDTTGAAVTTQDLSGPSVKVDDIPG